MTLLLSFCDHFSLTLINQLFPRLLSALVCLRLLSFTYNWRELPQVLLLSRQTRVCNDKTRLLSGQKYACRGKTFSSRQIFVAKNMCLSRQAYLCRDKSVLVAIKLVGINMCLSRQTFCRCKHTFVATKMVVVAAASSDTDPVCPMSEQELSSVILKSKPTTCSVDLIPASLLFDCCDQPILTICCLVPSRQYSNMLSLSNL